MRDQQQSVGIVSEIVLEPVTGFQIEVVRRLVQQEQVRLLQQEFGQRQPHLPSAGKFVRLPLPVLFAEAKPHEHAAHFGFNRVSIAGLELMLQPMIPVGHVGIFRAGVVEFCDAMHQGFEFLLHRAQLIEYRHALGKNRAPGKRKAILRQISCSGAFGDGERAVVQRVQSGEYLHQCRLAGAVRAHQANAVVGRDQPVSILEKEFVAETFSGARQLDHGSGFIVS